MLVIYDLTVGDGSTYGCSDGGISIRSLLVGTRRTGSSATPLCRLLVANENRMLLFGLFFFNVQ